MESECKKETYVHFEDLRLACSRCGREHNSNNWAVECVCGHLFQGSVTVSTIKPTPQLCREN